MSLFPRGPDEASFERKVYLRREAPEDWKLAWVVACDRNNFHEARDTPQTSGREEFERDVKEDYFNLLGQAAMALLLREHGIQVNLNWHSLAPKARELSRQGNVTDGVSVYVPVVKAGDLIIRQARAEATPTLLCVLLRVMRYRSDDEYLRAYGWRRAHEGWEDGVAAGPQGGTLRRAGDRIVPYQALTPMSEFLKEIR